MRFPFFGGPPEQALCASESTPDAVAAIRRWLDRDPRRDAVAAALRGAAGWAQELLLQEVRPEALDWALVETVVVSPETERALGANTHLTSDWRTQLEAWALRRIERHRRTMVPTSGEPVPACGSPLLRALMGAGHHLGDSTIETLLDLAKARTHALDKHGYADLVPFRARADAVAVLLECPLTEGHLVELSHDVADLHEALAAIARHPGATPALWRHLAKTRHNAVVSQAIVSRPEALVSQDVRDSLINATDGVTLRALLSHASDAEWEKIATRLASWDAPVLLDVIEEDWQGARGRVPPAALTGLFTDHRAAVRERALDAMTLLAPAEAPMVPDPAAAPDVDDVPMLEDDLQDVAAVTPPVPSMRRAARR